LTVGAAPLDAQNAPGQLLGGGARNLRHNFINVAHDQDVKEIFVRMSFATEKPSHVLAAILRLRLHLISAARVRSQG
jgi:hypothetical protein